MLLTDITIIRISISCAVHHNDPRRVYTSVFSHCTPPLPLKQFLKTFNCNFTLVYYMAD